jgi:hypothetical protein
MYLSTFKIISNEFNNIYDIYCLITIAVALVLHSVAQHLAVDV